jgi:ribosomal protein S18 acetylase RimI-like enzyme
MTDQITLRTACREDLEFLYQLWKITLGEYLVQTFGPWHEDEQHQRFCERTRIEQNQIVELDGHAVGCLYLKRLATAVKLSRVLILPEYQNRGLGSRLVQQVISEAQTVGLSVQLRVMKVNPAQRLWKRLGFVVTGKTETHILMEYVSKHPNRTQGLT